MTTFCEFVNDAYTLELETSNWTSMTSEFNTSFQLFPETEKKTTTTSFSECEDFINPPNEEFEDSLLNGNLDFFPNPPQNEKAKMINELQVDNLRPGFSESPNFSAEASVLPKSEKKRKGTKSRKTKQETEGYLKRNIPKGPAKCILKELKKTIIPEKENLKTDEEIECCEVAERLDRKYNKIDRNDFEDLVELSKTNQTLAIIAYNQISIKVKNMQDGIYAKSISSLNHALYLAVYKDCKERFGRILKECHNIHKLN